LETNVECGLNNGNLLGLYFYEGTLSGKQYNDFLLNELPAMLDEHPLDINANLIFQQDKAPAHFSTLIILATIPNEMKIFQTGG